MSTLNYWYSNVDYKQRGLTHIFGVCLVFALISSIFTVAFGSFSLQDTALLPLLLLTLVGAFPYVEVAVKADNASTSPKVLTASLFKKHLSNRSSKYTILTSRLAMYQPIYAALCVISFAMVSIYLTLGKKFINIKTVIGFLILQVPFNPLCGFNPVVTRLLRMPESRFVTQSNIFQSLTRYNANKFSPDTVPVENIMNRSTEILFKNEPLPTTTKVATKNSTQNSTNEKTNVKTNDKTNDNKNNKTTKEILAMLKNPQV